MKDGWRGLFFPKLRVRVKEGNNSSPHGKIRLFLFSFSCKFPDGWGRAGSENVKNRRGRPRLFFLLLFFQIPLVPRPLFRSSPLTESLEQAIYLPMWHSVSLGYLIHSRWRTAVNETAEAEEQFAGTFRNVSWKNGNVKSKFRITVLKFAKHIIFCSTRVNKRNPTSVHANAKLIHVYRFHSIKISSRMGSCLGLIWNKEYLYKSFEKVSAKLRVVVICLYINLKVSLAIYRALFTILERRERTISPFEFFLTAERSVTPDEVMGDTGMQNTSINRKDCSKFKS